MTLVKDEHTIILFVLADGWYLMVGSLVRSFGTG